MRKQKLKVLVPVDGSDQSFQAVLYAAGMFPFDRTEMVLFHVDAQNPDLSKTLSENPMFHDEMKKMDKWMAADHQIMHQFMEKAVDRIRDFHFPESAVDVKIKNKGDRVLDDIIQESREEYDAVVVGKTGKSRLKDKFIGSRAIKLAGKMRNIPLIIVDGTPKTDTLLLSIDRREEAFKSIDWIASLLDIQRFNITLCHIARCHSIKGVDHRQKAVSDEKYMCPLRDVECICPSINSMKECLVEEGVFSDHLTDLIVEGDNPASVTLELTRSKRIGSIVVGRRAIVPFVEALISGRYSQKILKKMENMALWVVT